MKRRKHTSQTINSPLFKLLKRYVSRGRCDIKVQSMLVLQILVCGRRELFLAMVDIISTFGIDTGKVLSDHFGCISLNFLTVFKLFDFRLFDLIQLGIFDFRRRRVRLTRRDRTHLYD